MLFFKYGYGKVNMIFKGGCIHTHTNERLTKPNDAIYLHFIVKSVFLAREARDAQEKLLQYLEKEMKSVLAMSHKIPIPSFVLGHWRCESENTLIGLCVYDKRKPHRECICCQLREDR